jgi:hypothetical protein
MAKMAGFAVQHIKLKQIYTFLFQTGLAFVQGTYSLIDYLPKPNTHISNRTHPLEFIASKK